MKIVAISACTMGVAHTFIAKDKLEQTAQRLGHQIKVETQGNIGAENVLSEEDVKNADVVIIAADINVGGQERFVNKPIVRVPVTVAIKQPEQLFRKIEEKLKEGK